MKTYLLPLLAALSFLFLSCGAAQSEPYSSDSVLTQTTAVRPQNTSEKKILEKVPEAAVGQKITAGKYSVVVTNAYFAASGRECKSLLIEQATSKQSALKTVCEFEGNWGYAPDVIPVASGQ